MNPEKLEKLRQDIVFTAQLRGRPFLFHSTWGLFNPKSVDPGSRLLIEQFEVPAGATCLDLGCGYGPIGLVLAHLAPEGIAHLVDKDFAAVEYARKNAGLNHLSNCQVYLSNGFSHVPEKIRFDLIASNLPAKAGGELLYLLLCEAHARLNRGGKLYVVTIGGLKGYIRRNFREIFGNCEKVKQGRAHVVSMAVKE